jgi:hypothetical protein
VLAVVASTARGAPGVDVPIPTFEENEEVDALEINPAEKILLVVIEFDANKFVKFSGIFERDDPSPINFWAYTEFENKIYPFALKFLVTTFENGERFELLMLDRAYPFPERDPKVAFDEYRDPKAAFDEYRDPKVELIEYKLIKLAVALLELLNTG